MFACVQLSNVSPAGASSRPRREYARFEYEGTLPGCEMSIVLPSMRRAMSSDVRLHRRMFAVSHGASRGRPACWEAI